MAQTSVAQFASELKVPPSVLLEQLRAAGVEKKQADDALSEQDKSRLLEYLRRSHGSTEQKNKITLTRKQTSEIKKTDATGKYRTVQVEVRKKRVFVKRDPAEVTAAAVAAEAPPPSAAAPRVDVRELELREEEARREQQLAELQAAELREKQERERREAEQKQADQKVAEGRRGHQSPDEARQHGHHQPGARPGDGDDRGRGDGPQGQAGEAGGSGVLSRRDRRAARDRGAATPAGGDRDGTRRSRQDLA